MSPSKGEAAARVHVCAGKGGVGRSVIALALARGFAKRGQQTLAVEVSASGVSELLGRAPSADPVQVEDRLWVVRLTPDDALREYALMKLRVPVLYRVVFENRLVRSLLRAIPSLGEFTMLGKLWYHAVETSGGLPRFDRVVVDAPATGHAVSFLSVARSVADVSPPGMMRSAAEKMADLVEDPERLIVHVVAAPEELAVNEALELQVALRERTRSRVGALFVNRALGVDRPSDRAVLAKLSEDVDQADAFRACVSAFAARWDREQAERARLEPHFSERVLIEELRAQPSGQVRALLAHVEEAVSPWLEGVTDAR